MPFHEEPILTPMWFARAHRRRFQQCVVPDSTTIDCDDFDSALLDTSAASLLLGVALSMEIKSHDGSPTL
jgi:hypothetical protein